jgi:nicotinamide phosphoribosyltransferase
MSIQRTFYRKLEKAIADQDWSKMKDIQRVLGKILEKPDNLILLTDAYKYSHPRLYTSGLTKLVSYMESRGGKFGETVFFGLQIYLKTYLDGVAILAEDVDEAHEYLGTKLGVFGRDDVFDRSKFDYIVEKHGGKLPVKISALPEGTVVGTHNVLMMIESLDPECAWLTNFLESLLLQIWYTITVATLSREVKKIVVKYFRKCTSYGETEIMAMVGYVLNDFGFRGVSSVQSAKHGGAAHLVNFNGSDNVSAAKLVCELYNTKTVYAGSIIATEHSIMSLRGESGELKMMRDLLVSNPTGSIACVSDTYNIFKACSEYWGDELRDLILSRAPGDYLIVRPDSGHVTRTLLEVFNILFDKFGFILNDKGYKVLPPQIRVIQGDGVNYESIGEIYTLLDDHKISPENIALGMGGKLLQADINRDTQNFAFKACMSIIDGEVSNMIKSPTEMDVDGNLHKSFKKSKPGMLKAFRKDDGQIGTISSLEIGFDETVDLLEKVFDYGVITKEYKFEDVRELSNIGI